MTSYEITDTSTQHIELDHKLEKVGSTKISGFENIWFSCLTNEEVVQYLKEFQPKQYEKCQSIHYELLPNLKNPSITSQFNPKSHEITIWSPIVWEKWFTGKENTKIHILDTIARQVGHNAYENISTSEWKKIHQSQAGFVSTNAKNTEIEDFAESFATYRNDPNLLKFKSPEKYEFMKSQVFFGKEYTT
ncbi:hypothetical protein, partial [Dolichospermum sp. LEGE 00246]|uniref:hypothetical protein n=1 Tax=Dolichospermum sp. LEGE 00246 TaxID=1828605 RepID=UPI00187F401B